MQRPRALPKQRLPDTLASVPMSATARLRALVLVEDDLEALVDLFASALAEDGIAGHFCIGKAADGATVPLFGDAPELMTAPQGAITVQCETVNGIESVILAPPAAPLTSAATVRARGFALLYAARAAVLLEKRRDHDTGCGLTLCQRYVLGQLLAGERMIDIAAALDRSVAAVMELLADAVQRLGAASDKEAISLAARRGWLLITVNEISALSLKKADYYSAGARVSGPGDKRFVASRNEGKSRALS